MEIFFINFSFRNYTQDNSHCFPQSTRCEKQNSQPVEIIFKLAFKPLKKLFLGAFPVPVVSLIFPHSLLGFFVQCMSSAESTIFLGLHPVRMCLLVFGGIVVTLFTFCACQCNSCTHLKFLQFFYRILSIKKRPVSYLVC